MALIAVRDDELLAIQFYVEGCASFGKGCLERRSVEVLVFTLGTLAGDVRKSLRPAATSFGTCRLNCFPVITSY